MADKREIALKNPFLEEEIKGKQKSAKKNRDVIEIKLKDNTKIDHAILEIGAFKRYKEQWRIALNTAEAFNSESIYNNDKKNIIDLPYKEIRKNGLTFFMSDRFRRTGLLSLCPALVTGMKLYDELQKAPKDLKNEKERIRRTNETLLKNLKSGIDAVLKFIYRSDGDWRNNTKCNPVFDASPYIYEDNEDNAFYPGKDGKGYDGRSYIDSISWAVYLFLRIMNMKAVNGDKKFVFEDEYREKAKELAQWCLNYVNDAVLTDKREDVDEKGKFYQRPVGWSFTKAKDSDDADPLKARSLYFTYAASSTYLAFYSEYEEIIDALMCLNKASAKATINFKLESDYHKDRTFKSVDVAIREFEKVIQKFEKAIQKFDVAIDASDTYEGVIKEYEDAIKAFKDTIDGNGTTIDDKIREILEEIEKPIEKLNDDDIKTVNDDKTQKKLKELNETAKKVSDDETLQELNETLKTLKKLGNKDLDAEIRKNLKETILKELTNIRTGLEEITLKDLKDAHKILTEPENEEKINDYFDFNGNQSAEFNGKIYKVDELDSLGTVSRFKWNLEKISEDIWKSAKDKLENNFVYDNFEFKEATKEAIESGGQTNALFAGLLQISICLYSAFNEVILNSDEKVSGLEFGEKAHDEMQNIMLLHVQRIQRYFDRLEKEGKAFGVDSLILRFSEDYSDADRGDNLLTDRELAEKLRKQSIYITSLTPMLLKTNNMISEYVIKYPQKQMSESLVQIGRKRFYDRKKNVNDDNEKYLWFWESDGYHSMSNYYYVGAIFDFYTYYKKYEERYIARYREIVEELKKETDYTDSVREHYQKINDDAKVKIDCAESAHEKDKKIYETKIAELEEKVGEKGIGEGLVKNINQVIENSAYFDNPEFFKRIIEGMRRQLASELYARYENKPGEDAEVLKELEKKEPVDPKDDTFFSLLQAFAADIILPSAIEARKEISGMVKNIGKGGGFDGEGYTAASVALKGGKQLINEDTDGSIGDAFAEMFSSLVWKFQKNK